jgi:peptidyl-prolyl cis-trans isomerase D
MWIIAILVVPAFLLWGSGSVIRSKGNIRFAGTIFGKRISLRDYAQSLSACRNQAKLIYGDKFSDVAEYLNLKEQAWTRLILLYQAKREKISVKDDEVINWIKSSPLFQKDGRFSRSRYNLILQYLLRVQPRKFEEELRDSLKIAKLREAVVREVNVTEDEVKVAYRRKYEKREVSYILIESKDFKEKLTLTEEELKNYYEDNREEFRLPEQVNVEYLNLAFDKFKGQVSISDEDIKDYYNTHLKEFIIPSQEAKEKNKEPKYRSLSEVKDNIKSNLIFQEAKHKAQIKASQIIEDLIDEPDFEKIAQKYAVSFGETGFFAPQESIPGVGFSYQFAKEAFELAKDEISEIITTPTGLYIIRLKEKKASYIPSFEEAKTKIEEAVRRIKAKELARKKAEEILPKLKESNFEDVAKELSLTIKKSEPFTREGYIPDIGEAPAFSWAAFNLKIGQISKAVSTPKGYCLLRLDNIREIDEKKYTQEKKELKTALLKQKKEQYFQNWLLKLKEEANLSSNLGES